MKVLLGILLLLFSSIPICFSQIISNDNVRLNKLPPEGILLDKGWKFHEGDDSAWANPAFDDNTWEAVNPAQDIRHVRQLQETHIGWFRIKLLVDSTLFDQPLGILLSQTGA
jgi:two-component system, NtrC family, sensor kinase